ncbi:MAG: Glu-tRNA(Gln) amidotransferase GatDE subunit E [Thermoprotei archaeon]|nr:MAG: Glu-tRNA(Gln) amidotransferase GatDE subunit E [Thermoprotei archaeon]
MELDYQKLGLKVGLEFHQMLDTKGKLFCSCPTKISKEKASLKLLRYLRPAQSELGEVDPAAQFEYERKRTFIYEYSPQWACLVELDEEPPHDLDREALRIALTIALMLGSKPVDEVQVMRKIVIDGSNTTGFQRTALIAIGGSIRVDGKEIPIQTICLEEDAARIIDVRGDLVNYRLDRLGIPLIEIATAPVINSPEEAELVALRIGQLLRITGMVKRGLGTIRQDLNVSIKEGAKIEIKGVQKLELISKVIKYEVLRQYNLLKIRDELRKRGINKEDLEENIVDVTEHFQDTNCRVIKKVLKRNGRVLAIKLKGFKGLLGLEIQPKRRFGTELADYARAWTGIGGIFHSDELPAYGITEEEVLKVNKALDLEEYDAFVLIAGPPERCRRALEIILERAKAALNGVPEETRGPNPDGTTHYTRPRPGAARMYPETDIRPVRITKEMLEEIKSKLPEPPEKKYERFIKEYRLGEELARKMLRSYYLDLFERIVEECRVSPRLVASVLEDVMKGLRREGVPVEELEDKTIVDVFKALSEGKMSKEAIPEVLRYLAENRDKGVEDALRDLGVKVLSLEELDKIILRILQENTDLIKRKRERAFSPLMGLIMREVRGKVDGRIVSERLKEKLSEILSQL